MLFESTTTNFHARNTLSVICRMFFEESKTSETMICHLTGSFQYNVLKNGFEKKGIPAQILMKLVPPRSIGNKSPLVQVMAWHHTGAKPLIDSIMIKFTDTDMHHDPSMSYIISITIPWIVMITLTAAIILMTKAVTAATTTHDLALITSDKWK